MRELQEQLFGASLLKSHCGFPVLPSAFDVDDCALAETLMLYDVADIQG